MNDNISRLLAAGKAVGATPKQGKNKTLYFPQTDELPLSNGCGRDNVSRRMLKVYQVSGEGDTAFFIGQEIILLVNKQSCKKEVSAWE